MAQYPPQFGPGMGGPVQPHRGTMILVLGILSLVLCPILGPFAWVMGNTDMQEMAAGRMDRSGELS
ncbi:MAG: hypothetical protein HYS13_22615 [Planctomycetia bacterium]|nr:hypothetical protein [Planctomycetia bacterium]